MTENETEEMVEEPKHVLVLGEKSFVCRDDAKIKSVFFRFAGDETRIFHEILQRSVQPEDLDDAWDAFEDVGWDAGTDALMALAATYEENDRPLGRRSPSSRGSKSTKRK